MTQPSKMLAATNKAIRATLINRKQCKTIRKRGTSSLRNNKLIGFGTGHSIKTSRLESSATFDLKSLARRCV